MLKNILENKNPDPAPKYSVGNTIVYAAMGGPMIAVAALNALLAFGYHRVKKLSALDKNGNETPSSLKHKKFIAGLRKRLPQQLHWMTEAGTSNIALPLVYGVAIGLTAALVVPVNPILGAAVITANAFYIGCNTLTFLSHTAAGKALLLTLNKQDGQKAEAWRNRVSKVNAPFLGAVGDVALMASGHPEGAANIALFTLGGAASVVGGWISGSQIGKPEAQQKNMQWASNLLAIGVLAKGIATLNLETITSNISNIPALFQHVGLAAASVFYALGYRDLGLMEKTRFEKACPKLV
jgi:hypothetical protein